MRPSVSVAALLLLAASCTGGEKPAPPAQDAPAATPTGVDRATTAAGVANAIAANPPKADSILGASGYTAESFQRLMYEIAADSAMSAAYAAARTK